MDTNIISLDVFRQHKAVDKVLEKMQERERKIERLRQGLRNIKKHQNKGAKK